MVTTILPSAKSNMDVSIFPSWSNSSRAFFLVEKHDVYMCPASPLWNLYIQLSTCTKCTIIEAEQHVLYSYKVLDPSDKSNGRRPWSQRRKNSNLCSLKLICFSLSTTYLLQTSQINITFVLQCVQFIIFKFLVHQKCLKEEGLGVPLRRKTHLAANRWSCLFIVKIILTLRSAEINKLLFFISSALI